MDTLRDEACPVCGEQDAWDGAECAVCGFVSPPSKFQDPDVDMHKQLDLRKDQSPDGTEVGQLNADTNDADGDGLDDNTGLPVDDEQAGAMDQQPLLECPNCGFQAEAGHPVSVDTADPQAGAEGGPDADGPAEGDLCPACGKGLMESGTELAEEGIDPEADPDAMPDDDEVDPRDQDPNADPDADADPRDPDDDGDLDEDPEADPDGAPARLPMDGADDDEEDEEEDDEDRPPAKRPFPPGKK